MVFVDAEEDAIEQDDAATGEDATDEQEDDATAKVEATDEEEVAAEQDPATEEEEVTDEFVPALPQGLDIIQEVVVVVANLFLALSNCFPPCFQAETRLTSLD